MAELSKYTFPGGVMYHHNGTPWWKAKIPWRWHRCKSQTFGEVDGELVRRCACGAIWVMGIWSEKNSRKKLLKERAEEGTI